MATRLRRPARWAMAAVGLFAVVIYLRSGASNAQPATTSPALRAAVAQIAAAVPPDRQVLTDDPMLPFLARRPVADQLIDTSLTRIWSGQITEAGLRAALAAEHTDAAVFWRGTFHDYFPGLEATAAARFRDRIETRPGRVLFLNRARGSARPTVSRYFRSCRRGCGPLPGIGGDSAEMPRLLMGEAEEPRRPRGARIEAAARPCSGGLLRSCQVSEKAPE